MTGESGDSGTKFSDCLIYTANNATKGNANKFKCVFLRISYSIQNT